MKVEAHGAIGIDVRERAPERANVDFDANLFHHLAFQARLDRLAIVTLSTREFPASSLVIRILPPRDQNLRAVP